VETRDRYFYTEKLYNAVDHTEKKLEQDAFGGENSMLKNKVHKCSTKLDIKLNRNYQKILAENWQRQEEIVTSATTVVVVR